MSEFFDRLRMRRSVLKRTTRKKELPEAVLYLEWLGGETSRKVMDPAGNEQVLTDHIIESNYKLVGNAEAKKLIAAHWANEVAQPQQPVRKPA